MPDAGTADAARAFVAGNLSLDTSALVAAVREARTDSYAAGLLVAATQTGQLGASLGQTVSQTAAMWDSWRPGNADAAALLSDGALESALADADITVKGLSDTALSRLGTLLAEGVAAGDSTDAVARSLAELLDDPARAFTIARTETARAVSAASMAGYAAAGVRRVSWLVSPEACDVCDGYSASGPYDLADAPVQPEHPSCRCSYSPVDPGPSAPLPVGEGSSDVSAALGSIVSQMSKEAGR
jgi:hypothetical protein